MKKVFKYFVIFLIVLLIGGAFYLYPRLPIINGYAAKMACSCTFVGNRSIESINKEELSFFPISIASTNIDRDKQTASASFLGLRKQTAYYNPQTGCALVSKDKSQEYQDLSFTLKNRYTQADSLYWPYSSFINDQKPSGINIEKLKAASQKHFAEAEGEEDKNTRALLIIYKDQIVLEEYADGFDENSRMLGWSMTKSLLNAMIGILVKQGKININDPVPIPEWKNDKRKDITWNNLLQMSSGLDWEEDYTTISNVTKMLYLENNMYEYTIKTEYGKEPGTFFKYSSGTSNILSGLVRKETKENYLPFVYDELFAKIGANSFVIEADGVGNLVASSYGWATARDWAKFGLLYLHDGNWNGNQILPKGWAKYSGTMIPQSKGYVGGHYGAHFWVQNPSRVPDAPKDMYMAEGFQEQRVYVLPSHDMVIVRLGLTHGMTDFNGLVTEVVNSIEK